MNEIISENIAKLRLNEWQAIQQRAKKLWLANSLGERPTFDGIKKTLPNPHTISALEWLAVVVLLVLTAFTSYKVGALAVPFATHTLETLTQHTSLAEWVQTTFIGVTALLFMLLATPSVIYFKLLSHEPEVTQEKRETRQTRWYMRWTLDYLTPRLPALIVYISVGWLVYISSQLPGTAFEQFLPVVVEVGLAALVGNILKKRKNFNKIVTDALYEKTEPYDTRLKNYETDGAYLRTLYQVMREEVAKLKRPEPNGRGYAQVNAWLEAADDQVVYSILSKEYRRLTSGDQFAHAVVAGTAETPVENEPTEIRTTLRRPPMGEQFWTPDSLAHDLRVRGLDPAQGYTEAQLQADYDKAYKPRSAWRAGARKQFLGQ